MTKTVYWDSCVWISWINQEKGRFEKVNYAIEEAKKGNLRIMTSMLTLAEVCKVKCDGEVKSSPEASDDPFATLLDSRFIILVEVDWFVCSKARWLFRNFQKDGLGKPNDAIHLATALLESVDELHTFDGGDFSGIVGKVMKEDGKPLVIGTPPDPPPVTPVLPGLEEPSGARPES